MKHLIENYEQIKAHLTALNKDYNKRTIEYRFAVGDLFEEAIPPSVSAANFSGTSGLSAVEYQRRIAREIDQLMLDTDAEFTRDQLTAWRVVARAWDRKDRRYKVSWSVYHILASEAHQDKIRDGMTITEAREIVAANRQPGNNGYVRTPNITQRMRAAINAWIGIMNADTGEPLTPEAHNLVLEAYAVLDKYSALKGVNLWEEPKLVTAA